MQTTTKILFLFLFVLGFHAFSKRTTFGQEPSDLNSIELNVTDMDGKAIAGADASVVLWDGSWNELPIRGETDEAGKVVLAGLPPNKYGAVIVKAAGFAPICSSSELAKKEKRSLHLKLSKPVTSKISIRDDKGKPVRGAMLSLLVVNDKGGGSLATRFGSNTPYGTTLPESDEDGNIVLNDLPIGASVSVTVLHPDWVQEKVQDLIASEGHIGSAYLKSGDKIQINLIRDETVPEFSVSELFNLNAMPNEADRKSNPYVYHLFQAIDDQLYATVARCNHESIKLRAQNDEIIVTPYIDRSDERFTEILAKPVDGKRSIDFLVRKARSFQCKLVGDLSLINDESYVSGSTENKGPNEPSKIGSRTEYSGCSFVEPSKDGSFTVKLPNGRACISVYVPGAKITPSRFEFLVEPDKEPIIPEFRIEKLQKLQGRTVDAEGNPVRNAVVRFYHGMWGTDYQRSNDQGEFQLDTEGQLVATEKAAESSICRVMAFDPKGARAGMVEIDPKTFDDRKTLTVVMEDRSPTWVIDQIQEFLVHGQPEERRKFRELYTQELQNQRKAFAAGDTGQVPPDLSEGEWLQSDCKSLEELRGKLVLLDFWFIGCGPCAADMPTLKLARELFGGAEFEIVGVHASPASAESVRQYIEQNGVKYPTVVDTHEETISRRFKELGVTSFPTYILLDRDGKIMHNDHLSLNPSLRVFKVEVIYSALRSARE
jgi:thiol-disulfide isomerase/thioredoxin